MGLHKSSTTSCKCLISWNTEKKPTILKKKSTAGRKDTLLWLCLSYPPPIALIWSCILLPLVKKALSWKSTVVVQLPSRVCDPMDCSTPALSVPHHLPKFAQVYVHCNSDATQPSHPLMLFSPFALNLFPLLEKEMASHSSTLAWKIPRTEEPDRLQSMGLHRVGHDWVTSLSPFPLYPNENTRSREVSWLTQGHTANERQSCSWPTLSLIRLNWV